MTERNRIDLGGKFARWSVGVLLVVILAVALGPATGTAAADAPDCSTVTYNGDGTTSNPFEVGNVDQLQCIEEQGLDESYEIVSDIDATGTSSWNFGSGFEPIGSDSNPFTGGLSGNGNTITGLTIARGGTNKVGLFSVIGSGGGVQGVNLEDVEISGGGGVGALAGNNLGTVSESSASGGVTASGENSGGLVGSSGSTVIQSFAKVDVTGNRDAGGLVGDNGGTITNSYARGDVSGGDETGGLVGENTGGGSVSQSYSTGEVSGSSSIGGLIGRGGAASSYWDVPASGQTGSAGGTGLGDSNEDPPADEMTGDDAPNNMQGFDFTNTWDTVTDPDDYPILAWQVEPTATFTVSPTNPETGETVTFDASGSDSREGAIQSYDWDFDGDGTNDETTTTPTTTHTYSNSGTFDASVTVTDDGGRTDTATTTVVVEPDDGGGEGNATVKSGDVRVGSTGETGESAITVDAENGLSIANVEVSVDTSVAEIQSVSEGADVDSSQPAQTFNVIDQTADSVRIEYSNLQAQASPIQDFELARVEFESQTDDGETPIQILTDELRDGNTDSYGTVSEDEGTFSVGAALFEDPLPGFSSPPQNTGELDPNLFEDADGDGDGTDPTQAVTLWTQLVLNPQDFNSLTQEQTDALDWNGDGQLTPADAVSLWTEQVLN